MNIDVNDVKLHNYKILGLCLHNIISDDLITERLYSIDFKNFNFWNVNWPHLVFHT